MKLNFLKFVTKITILTGVITAVTSSIIGLLMFFGTTEIIFNDALDHLKDDSSIKSKISYRISKQ